MTQTAPITETLDNDEQPKCQHYWVIQPATGPISPGVCQTCGELREFKNYVEASTWGDDKASSRAPADVARTVGNQSEDDQDE